MSLKREFFSQENSSNIESFVGTNGVFLFSFYHLGAVREEIYDIEHAVTW